MNWRIKIVNRNYKVIKTWIIKNKPEIDAYKEANKKIQNEIGYVYDWTMMPCKRK